MQNLRPHLQRFFALLRRNPRQTAIAAVIIAGTALILINPAPQRVEQPQPAANPAGGSADPAPRDVKTIDLQQFPEPAGVRVDNMSLRAERNTPLHGNFYAVHVTDPTRPAAMIWEHTLRQPAAHVSIGATLQLYNPADILRLQSLTNYAPELEIIADGQIVRPLAPAPWGGDKTTVTLQLPNPATHITARIVLPPRLQAGYVSITQLQMESW
ncbi:MAG: hypothetical protein KGZ54_03515 [Dethiobacter sp.]|nr:hypothetical protein [Dethiobacter sp.]MBS3988888.1 hypothetical protein [Dethiobacter sp.]